MTGTGARLTALVSTETHMPRYVIEREIPNAGKLSPAEL
jgi:hypothetical protein